MRKIVLLLMNIFGFAVVYENPLPSPFGIRNIDGKWQYWEVK